MLNHIVRVHQALSFEHQAYAWHGPGSKRSPALSQFFPTIYQSIFLSSRTLPVSGELRKLKARCEFPSSMSGRWDSAQPGGVYGSTP